MFILPSSLSETESAKVHEQVLNTIKNAGGEVVKNETLGRRRFAYAIKHEQYGVYLLVQFDIETANLKKLHEALRGMQEILRYLLVQIHVKTQAEIEKEQRIKERIEMRRVAAQVQEQAQEREKALAEERKEEKKVDDDKKISLEELDTKLDEILKEDITK